MKWLREGDRNTTFFHQSTISRRRRNKIVRLRDDEGEWVVGERDITRVVYSFYRNLFQSKREGNVRDHDVGETLNSIPTQISAETNEKLTGSATMMEVKKAAC